MSKDKKWVHTLCVIGAPGVSFKDVTKMTMDLSLYKKESNKVSAKKKCEICRNKIETFLCKSKSGDKYCHIHCALQQNVNESDNSLWKAWFNITPNPSARVSEAIDGKRIMEDVEDMALSLKEVFEKVGMIGELGIIMELKPKKGAKPANGKKRVQKEDARISRFIEEVVDRAKSSCQRLLGEEDEEDVAGEIVKQVGGRIFISYGINSKEEEIRKSKNLDNRSLLELLQTLYRVSSTVSYTRLMCVGDI